MKKKGFTLVEMLVAIGIFSIFMGVLITSYMSVVKGLRGAEEYRELYADARHTFDTILENARNSTVYGGCDNTVGEFKSDLDKLSFCSTDGLKKVTFEYMDAEDLNSGVVGGGASEGDEGGGREGGFASSANNGGESSDIVARKVLKMTVEEKQDPLSLDSGYVLPEESVLNSEGVNIKSFSFKVFPATDPFKSSYSDIPYQPVVIIDGVFERKSASVPSGSVEVELHTSVSLRTYN